MTNQIGHNYEKDLSESKIDFFITQQRFIGFIDLSNEHCHNYYEFFYTKSGNRLFRQDPEYEQYQGADGQERCARPRVCPRRR